MLTEEEFLKIKKAAKSHPELRQCKGIKDVYLTLVAMGLEGEKKRLLGAFTAAVNAQESSREKI